MCRICSHFFHLMKKKSIKSLFLLFAYNVTLTKYTLGLLLIISIKKNVKRMSKGCDSNF